MAHYRVYNLVEGHVAGASAEIECKDDEEAIAVAKRMVDGRDLELWKDARLVTRLKSKK